MTRRSASPRSTSRLAQRVTAALARNDAARRHAAPSAVPKRWASEAALHRAVVATIAVEASPGTIALHIPNGGKRPRIEAAQPKGLAPSPAPRDLLVIANGRAHGLELKTPAGRLSAEQKAMQARFIRSGAEYEVARSLAEARATLSRWCALADGPLDHRRTPHWGVADAKREQLSTGQLGPPREPAGGPAAGGP